jgi:hypothetical protein
MLLDERGGVLLRLFLCEEGRPALVDPPGIHLPALPLLAIADLDLGFRLRHGLPVSSRVPTHPPTRRSLPEQEPEQLRGRLADCEGPVLPPAHGDFVDADEAGESDLRELEAPPDRPYLVARHRSSLAWR